MAEDHLSRDWMQRFFRAELSRQDTHEVVRHLLRRCEACWRVAVEVGAEEGFVYQDGDFQNALFPDAGERYHDLFLRLLGSVDAADLELARERLRGLGLWHRLEREAPRRRLALIRKDPRLATWGLYDRLLETSRELGFQAPHQAAGMARLALAVTKRLDPARYGENRIADFRAGALAALGNALRLASDFAGAEKAFGKAREALERGTGDPLEAAQLLSLKASWRKDLGEFEEAFAILEQVAAIYREREDTHLEGRILLKQAAVIGFVKPGKAIELAQDGLALIDPLREPRLEWCGRHTLALFLNDAGKPREALALLETSRSLYAQFNDPWTRIRQHWLEAKIARNLGDLAEAEETLKRLRHDLQDPAYAHELTLVSVDLAEVHVARGQHEEAARLVEDFLPLLRAWGMHAEGLALWLLMQKAIRERRAQADLFRRMADYLNRAWYRPLVGRG